MRVGPLARASVGALLLGAAAGHGVLLSPKARDGMAEGVGNKITPFPLSAAETEACDGTSAGAPVATVNPGMRLVVKYTVGIPHPAEPGVRLAIKRPGETFASLSTGGESGEPTLLVDDDDLDVGAEGEHFISLMIPPLAPDGPIAEPGDNFVLQWMWQSESDGGGYIGCSDIRIKLASEEPACGVFTSDTPPRTQGRTVEYTGDCSSSSSTNALALVLIICIIAALVLAIMYLPQLEGVRHEIVISPAWQRLTACSGAYCGNSGLPAGWEAVKDELSGDTYYYNAATGETTWNKPIKPPPDGSAPAPPAPAPTAPAQYGAGPNAYAAPSPSGAPHNPFGDPRPGFQRPAGAFAPHSTQAPPPVPARAGVAPGVPPRGPTALPPRRP